MGFFNRAATRSADRCWASLPPLCTDEQPIDYAHMVLALNGGDRPGTAYLTDKRLLWQTPDGRVLDFSLDDCVGFAVRDDRPGQTGLAAGFPVDETDAPFAVVLFPQNGTAANRKLAVMFVQAVAQELLRHRPEWVKQ